MRLLLHPRPSYSTGPNTRAYEPTRLIATPRTRRLRALRSRLTRTDGEAASSSAPLASSTR